MKDHHSWKQALVVLFFKVMQMYPMLQKKILRYIGIILFIFW